MPVAVVALYAGLNALVGFALAHNVMRVRRKTRTGLGAGGHTELEQAIRAHGNFVEYVPLILLLMLLLALGGVSALWLHGLGVTLTLARILHAWGLLSSPGRSFGRAAGATLTSLVLLIALIRCLALGVTALKSTAAARRYY